MAFGNNGRQNNNNQEQSTNTRGPQMYNRDKERGSTLICGFWNTMQTIKICPILPQDKRSESKMYNYETFLTSALVPEKAYALMTGIKKHVLPALESGELESIRNVGVPVGEGFIQISNGHSLGYPLGLYITIFSKIDAENGRAEQWLSFEFTQSPYFLNYNHEDGDISKEAEYMDFGIFMNYLAEGIKASSRAVAHSVRDQYKYVDNGRRNEIKQIMDKLGIESNNGYNNNRGNSGGQSNGFFGGGKINKNEGSGLEEKEIEYKDAKDMPRLPL